MRRSCFLDSQTRRQAEAIGLHGVLDNHPGLYCRLDDAGRISQRGLRLPGVVACGSAPPSTVDMSPAFIGHPEAAARIKVFQKSSTYS